MENVLGIINLANERELLPEFTNHICPAAVPYGGRYRLIDFVLSNMVNSNIAKIALFTHDKYYSLLEHIGTGREWDLDRNKDGLGVFPPLLSFLRDYRGDIQNYAAYLNFFKKSPQEYVLITGSNAVCKLDFRQIFAAHIQKEADITFLCKKDKYMGTMLLSKTLFLEIVAKCFKQNKFNFLEDGIMPALDSFKLYKFNFNGYIGIINSLQDYYYKSMELLNSKVAHELFDKGFPFYTKAKSDPPAKYGAGSDVRNTLVANGCVIEGKVENSILFWGVKIEPGAHIKNSILFPNSRVGRSAILENIILAKEMVVAENQILKSAEFEFIR